DGADDERVRREGQARGPRPVRTRQAERRLIFERRQHLVLEGRQKQALNQVGAQTSAAAVAQQNVLVIGQRHGAAQLVQIDPLRHVLESLIYEGETRSVVETVRNDSTQRRPLRKTPWWRPADSPACRISRRPGSRAAF